MAGTAQIGGGGRERLFIISCVAMVAVAMPFAVRCDILAALGRQFDLSHERQGLIQAAASWSYLFTVLGAGAFCDAIGMRRLLLIASCGHVTGTLLFIVSPMFGFPALLLGTFILGLADGVVEAVINPLVTTLYPGHKTGRLNFLHAGWPFGLIIGGLLCMLVSWLFGLGTADVAAGAESISWRVKMGMVLVPAVLYGVLTLLQKFPRTEGGTQGISTPSMMRETLRPGFLVLLLCMVLTSATEVGPDQWFGSVLEDTVGIGGIAFLVFTAGIGFFMRYNGGVLAQALSPYGLLVGSCFLAGLGLYGLSHAFTPLAALGAAALFGIGKACLWPTVLGQVSERYPRGGSFLLAVCSAVGMMAGGMAGPMIGKVYDHYAVASLPAPVARVMVVEGRYSPAQEAQLASPADHAAVREAGRQGASMAFRWMALVPVLPLAVFSVYWFQSRRRKGRPIRGKPWH